MRKEHYKEYYESSDDVPDDPDRYIVTRDDLEGDEIRVYDHYLAKLDHPSPDQLRMLAVYSWLAVKFKQAIENKNWPCIFTAACSIVGTGLASGNQSR